jgi:hypothetical protein
MKEITISNFGVLISYLLPGVTALWGLSYASPTVRGWFGALPPTAPTIGGFLYVTLAAVAAGLVLSTVRWMILDTIHALTGLRRPEFDYTKLAAKVEGFDVLVRHHYEYYKFHGNFLLALIFAWVSRRFSLGFFTAPVGWIDFGVLVLAVVLTLGSRNTLRNYYDRVAMLLG